MPNIDRCIELAAFIPPAAGRNFLQQDRGLGDAEPVASVFLRRGDAEPAALRERVVETPSENSWRRSLVIQ